MKHCETDWTNIKVTSKTKGCNEKQIHLISHYTPVLFVRYFVICSEPLSLFRASRD